MKTQGQSEPEQIGQLRQRLTELENRISKLEKNAAYRDRDTTYEPARQIDRQEIPAAPPGSNHEAIESRIGEYGMAWMGNIVLLFGILFLTQLFQTNNHTTISLIFGFSAVVLVYLAGYLTRNSLPYMSMLFNYNGHLLLYIQMMRVCLFKESMIITSPVLGVQKGFPGTGGPDLDHDVHHCCNQRIHSCDASHHDGNHSNCHHLCITKRVVARFNDLHFSCLYPLPYMDTGQSNFKRGDRNQD